MSLARLSDAGDGCSPGLGAQGGGRVVHCGVTRGQRALTHHDAGHHPRGGQAADGQGGQALLLPNMRRLPVQGRDPRLGNLQGAGLTAVEHEGGRVL